MNSTLGETVVGLSYFFNHSKKMDFYKQTNKELMRNNELLQFVHSWAVELGMDPAHTNSTNIKDKINKVLKDTVKYEEKAKQLGYSSLGNALKALSMITTKVGDNDSSALPEVFHTPPHSWIWGVTQDQKKGRVGIIGLGVKEAERRHRMIMPLLLEAWELATDNYDIQKELIISYRTDSHKEFEAELYTYIHNLEPLTLEEELEEITNPTELDPETEALVTVHKQQADAKGEIVSDQLLIARATSQLRRQKRRRNGNY